MNSLSLHTSAHTFNAVALVRVDSPRYDLVPKNFVRSADASFDTTEMSGALKYGMFLDSAVLMPDMAITRASNFAVVLASMQGYDNSSPLYNRLIVEASLREEVIDRESRQISKGPIKRARPPHDVPR